MRPTGIIAIHGTRIRFVVGGAINTALSYALYLLLRMWISYQLAFLVAYFSGIIMAYFINALLVFSSKPNWKSALSFPLVYLIQYGISAAVLELLVGYFKLDERLAPILINITMIPVTYFLIRTVFRATAKAIKEGNNET